MTEEEPTSKTVINKINVNKTNVGSNNDQEKASDGEGAPGRESGTPKGKVACLLCRGFVSYKSSDRTRFREHMESEHDVKFDSDVILALSVMSVRSV